MGCPEKNVVMTNKNMIRNKLIKAIVAPIRDIIFFAEFGN